MPDTSCQRQLTPEEGAAAPAVLDLKVPERLVKLVQRLQPSARIEFALRAPAVLQQLVDQIIAVGQIPDDELIVRLRHAEKDVERLTCERHMRAERRRTCPDCGARDGEHLVACERR